MPMLTPSSGLAAAPFSLTLLNSKRHWPKLLRLGWELCKVPIPAQVPALVPVLPSGRWRPHFDVANLAGKIGRHELDAAEVMHLFRESEGVPSLSSNWCAPA